MADVTAKTCPTRLANEIWLGFRLGLFMIHESVVVVNPDRLTSKPTRQGGRACVICCAIKCQLDMTLM